MSRRFTPKARAQALAALEDKAGCIDPHRLIDAAKDPNHPYHDDFPWDIQKAAEAKWLDIARDIIRSYRFVIEYSALTVAMPQAPVYVSDPETPETLYRNLSRIKKEKVKRAVLLEETARIVGNLDRALAIAYQLQDGAFIVAFQEARKALMSIP